MRREDLIRFARRDWEAAERSLAGEAKEHAASLTPGRRLEIASGLRESVRRLRPDWPSEDERDADLASHVELSKRLGRVVARSAR